MSEVYGSTHKLVAAWIPTNDFEMLNQLANKHNVKLSAYLRAIIVDALQDEITTISYTIHNNTTNHKVV